MVKLVSQASDIFTFNKVITTLINSSLHLKNAQLFSGHCILKVSIRNDAYGRLVHELNICTVGQLCETVWGSVLYMYSLFGSVIGDVL